MPAFTFETTPRVVCMQGGAAALADHVEALGCRRAFIVSDKGLVDAGIVAPATRSLERAGIEAVVHSDVQADPPEAVVLAAVEQCRTAGADVVVGFGGGSSLDTAKLVALLARSEQSLAITYGVGADRILTHRWVSFRSASTPHHASGTAATVTSERPLCRSSVDRTGDTPLRPGPIAIGA